MYSSALLGARLRFAVQLPSSEFGIGANFCFSTLIPVTV